MSEESPPLQLFEGFGIELEYMIVSKETLSVLPVCDEVLRAAAGEIVSEVEMGTTAWSNELALHVIEFKTNGPAPRLDDLHSAFLEQVRHANAILDPLGGCLMPTAMHPWMDPAREMRLWPHDFNPVYETFNRIFDCRGHGWTNLQSMHINLPFAGDDEFARLHAAIRLLLPIMPALSASSPVTDGKAAEALDNRLAVYRTNARRVPSVSGRVVPEPVYTRGDYENLLLEGIYRDLAASDPEGVLRHEWVNARGAIARFDRSAIEIRVLDVQETPQVDLAIAQAITAVVRALTAETWLGLEDQKAWAVDPLAAILTRTIADAEEAEIADPSYVRAFGFPGDRACAGELWHHLLSGMERAPWRDPVDAILEQGTLARRILRAIGTDFSRSHLSEVYRELCSSLASDAMFGV